MTWRGMLWAAAFAGLTGASLSASPISGTFNIAGTITVTQNAIDWQDNNAPFTMMQATIGPGAHRILRGTGRHHGYDPGPE